MHLSKARASSLGLFLANGVTTVRDMGGDHEELVGWRREIREGTLDGMSRDERVALRAAFARRGVPVVPTLVALFESRFVPAARLQAVTDDEAGAVEPRRAYASRYMVLDWREQVLEQSAERQALLRRIWNDVIRRDVREMHEAGVDVLAGSDVAVVNIVPGSSLHEELALLVREVGMSPARRSSARPRDPRDFSGAATRSAASSVARLLTWCCSKRNRSRTSGTPAASRLSWFAASTSIVRLSDRLLDEVRAHPDRQADDWGRTRPR